MVMKINSEIRKVEYVGVGQRSYDFDHLWQFSLGDAPGFFETAFDDSSWQDIDLPHDYSISRPYCEAGEAQSAYKLGGVGLYRKKFIVGEAKRYILYFDGIYCDSDFYINGKYLGSHHHGYTPIAFDISSYLYIDKPNTLAIRVDNPVPTSRWYSGSGIYRSAKLIITEDLAFDLYGLRIDTSNLEDRDSEVSIKISSKIINKSPIRREFTISHDLYFEDKLIKSYESDKLIIDNNITKKFIREFKISYPKLWDVDNPNLYRLVSSIKEKDKVLDTIQTPYGFRYYKFDKDTGFSLNGENMKLKAVCLHHDNGALGARDFYRASERKLNILKDMGTNAIRVTHNPASRKFIDLTNRLGFLLIEEIFDGWILDKNNDYNDYSRFFDKKIGQSQLMFSSEDMTWAQYDLRETLKRDYNDPSIIAYSLGNEILCGTNQAKRSIYPNILEDLLTFSKQIDKNRILTLGDNSLRDGYDPIFVKMEDYLTKEGAIVGLNYCNGAKYDKIHKDHPDWILWQSESVSSVNSRATYDRIDGDLSEDMRLTSFDKSTVGWGDYASEAWYDVIKRDFVAGEAVWTGFDYLGEPTPYNGITRGYFYGSPAPRSSFFGIIDLAGFAKDSYYFYRSQWNDKDITTHILPSYNKEDMEKIGGDIPITVYTNAHQVELIFIDEKGKEKSLGKQSLEEIKTKAGHTYRKVCGKKGYESLFMTWEIPFKEGSIKAISYDNDGHVIKNTIGRNFITSIKDAPRLSLSPYYENMGDGYDNINFISIDIVDTRGDILDSRDDEIHIEVSPNAEILALDNGLQSDFSDFLTDHKKAYGGRLLLVVRALKSGPIEITAKNKDLGETRINLENSFKRKIGTYDKVEGPSLLKNKILNNLKDRSYRLEALNLTKNIYPYEDLILPKQTSLIDNKCQILPTGSKVFYDNFSIDELWEKGELNIRAHVEDFNLKLPLTLKLKVIEETYKKGAYIEDFALGKRLEEGEIVYYFDTQQLIGDIEILSQDQAYRFFISEDDSSYREIFYKNKMTLEEKTIYEFNQFKATFIKIVGDMSKIDNLKIRSIKLTSTVSETTDLSSIRINGKELRKDLLEEDFIEIKEVINDYQIEEKDGAIATSIRSEKDLYIFIISENMKNIRKITIKGR